MYKMIFGAKRKPGMTIDEFQAYWTGTHAQKALKVPGMKRYVVSIAAQFGGSGREMPYDGFAEVWFESEEAMRASGRSEQIKDVLADEPNLFDMSTRWNMIVVEHVMKDG